MNDKDVLCKVKSFQNIQRAKKPLQFFLQYLLSKRK
jgi:hypothetical protein